MNQAMLDSTETLTHLRQQLTKRLTELDTQKDQYLDLLGDPEGPQDKIKARIRRTREEQAHIQRQLDDTVTNSPLLSRVRVRVRLPWWS